MRMHLYFLSAFISAVLLSCFMLLSCSESGDSFGTNVPAAQLAGEDQAKVDMVFFRSKDGEDPWIEQWLKPVRWDGVSPLETCTQTIYWFKSTGEVRKAMGITGPEYLKLYEDVLRKREKARGKQKTLPRLAVSYNAVAVVTYPGSNIKGEGC